MKLAVYKLRTIYDSDLEIYNALCEPAMDANGVGFTFEQPNVVSIVGENTVIRNRIIVDIDQKSAMFENE